MATYGQRAQAIGDALLNRAATLAQINKGARGLAHRAGRLAEYDAMTNAQKAQFFVERLREVVISAAQNVEAEPAAQAAVTASNAAIVADFAETPEN